MRVRHLKLHGFKTFAAKTTFLFEEGVTAIVGPNGSGKSNLADALRWVLGEQSYSTLRSRRTTDVIFSGSSARPPMGVAEVALLLDNEDGFLPVEYAEVEIARRAYRSGENIYLLNRRRVRLQDIQEVLGGITASYVVIHQGLVDEALSLRPRERRVLLEEAAEVHRYHERRQKAQDRLERTEANMTRISDLQSELVPRLRVLARQSKKARQRGEVEASLQQALRAWYRLRWEKYSVALEEARREEETSRAALTEASTRLEEAVSNASHLRQALREAQRHQEERRQEEAGLRRRQDALRQSLAREEGERRALQRYQQELSVELERWRQEVTAQGERQQQIEETYAAQGQRVEQARADLHRWEERFRQAEVDLSAAQARREDLQQRVMAMTVRILEGERRREQLSASRGTIEQEKDGLGGLLSGLLEQQGQLKEEKSQAEAALAILEAELSDLVDRETALHGQVSQRQEELRRAGEVLEQARLRLARDCARIEALAQGDVSGDGASFLQQWVEDRGGPSLTSLLSRLTIPPDLDAAVEAALGRHAAALVTPSWEDACAALDVLSSNDAGRATFLPREELRPVDSPPPLASESEGLLLDDLACSEEDAPALAVLLGRTLLAGDLETARRIARQLPAGWAVVTRQGQLITAEGMLSGGRIPSGRSVLVRERERHALAQSIVEAEEACQVQEQAFGEVEQRLAEGERSLGVLGRQREEQRLLREKQARCVLDLERTLDQVMEDSSRQRKRLESLRGEEQALLEEEADLEASLDRLRGEQVSFQEELDCLQRTVQSAQQEQAEARDRLQEARTTWALVQKEQENLLALREMYQRNVDRLQQQIDEGNQRLQGMLGRLGTWEEQTSGLHMELEQLARALEGLTASGQPGPVSLDELAQLDEEAGRWREEVRKWEGTTDRAAVAVERCQDRLKEVLRLGLAEVGPEASAYGPASEALLNALLEDPPDWARTPLDPAQSAEELERRIALLREEARRIGPVNPLAEEEHRQTEERYEFLGQQLQDLQDAARSLRQVIAELDRAMQERFEETFRAISREFANYFSRLFGGGTARLQLTRMAELDGGLDNIGVEIIARPPGKRAHTLALLSGGERALTSAALLFAIMKVNPRPFCLLDEVDAMLDDANVGRFRECLEELTDQTQFILITHNRGTIEAANTLYGISMGTDGASQVLSLRLEGKE